MTFVSAEKACFPIQNIEEGISISVSNEHPLKELSPITPTEDGIEIFANAVHM